jgi:hypothetical protein
LFTYPVVAYPTKEVTTPVKFTPFPYNVVAVRTPTDMFGVPISPCATVEIPEELAYPALGA